VTSTAVPEMSPLTWSSQEIRLIDVMIHDAEINQVAALWLALVTLRSLRTVYFGVNVDDGGGLGAT
jgi:hypothetical protein